VACTGSCLEEAGGPANLYVNPDDAAGLAEAICQVLPGNPDREQRIQQSQQYIKRFEGLDVAGQMMSIYLQMIYR
jgi:glycosyltransferase involved in cell wall biosynthesis